MRSDQAFRWFAEPRIFAPMMRPRQRSFSALALMILLATCTRSATKPETRSSAKLVPIDRSDPKQAARSAVPADTTLPSGWRLEFLVRNDSTKYEDLHVQWSKEGNHAVLDLPGVLSSRLIFIPELIGETDSSIVLFSACASDCRELIVLSKSRLTAVAYPHLVQLDLQGARALWVDSASFTHEWEPFRLRLSYFDTRDDTLLTFHGITTAIIKESVVDSTRFENRTIYLEAELRQPEDNVDAEHKEILVARTR